MGNSTSSPDDDDDYVAPPDPPTVPPATTTTTTIATAKFENPKIISKEINDYCLQIGHNESSVAEKLRLETAKHPRCRMMGDPIEASLFKILLPAMGAKRVIEVGVFTGYTTLVMAEAIGPKGRIVACDINEEFVNIGKPFWEQLGPKVAKRIDLRIAPASETLRGLIEDGQEDMYDFAFVDADKTSYKIYYELLLRLIRPNGIIAIDNVLWSGKVLNEEVDDEDTVALREMNEYVFQDERVEHVLLPFADGVTLVRKK